MWWGLIAGPYVAIILMFLRFRARLAHATESLSVLKSGQNSAEDKEEHDSKRGTGGNGYDP